MNVFFFRSNFLLLCLIAPLSFNVQAATITVNTLSDLESDDGDCTFREALLSANTDTPSGVTEGECAAGSGDDSIEFSIAGTIQPAGELPNVTQPVHINGYSAPGASVNTLPLEQGTNAILAIELDGVNAGNFPGLRLQGGASGSIVEGLVINNSANAQCCNTTGIYMSGITDVWIRGNFINVNPDGNAARPKGSRGIWATGTGIIIGNELAGSLNPAYTNLISGASLDGVLVNGGTNAVVRGNLIGTDRSGNSEIGNSSGIHLDGTNNAEVADNVISGNNGIGVYISANTSNAMIVRNLIGTNAAGTSALPNTAGGIRIQQNFNLVNATNQNIDILENLVAFNGCAGCSGGIIIGAAKAAYVVDAIRVQRNRIFSNAGLELDLAVTNGTDNGVIYGVTDNDPDDPDPGPNRLQNFPEISLNDVVAGVASIQVVLDSEASKTYTIDFYQTSSCDDSGHGGAEAWLGSEDVSTDANGDVTESFPISLALDGGFATATATHVDHGTSEFSLCVPLPVELLFEDGFEEPVP